jgi:hypothetical protein
MVINQYYIEIKQAYSKSSKTICQDRKINFYKNGL